MRVRPTKHDSIHKAWALVEASPPYISSPLCESCSSTTSNSVVEEHGSGTDTSLLTEIFSVAAVYMYVGESQVLGVERGLISNLFDINLFSGARIWSGPHRSISQRRRRSTSLTKNSVATTPPPALYFNLTTTTPTFLGSRSTRRLVSFTLVNSYSGSWLIIRSFSPINAYKKRRVPGYHRCFPSLSNPPL